MVSITEKQLKTMEIIKVILLELRNYSCQLSFLVLLEIRVPKNAPSKSTNDQPPSQISKTHRQYLFSKSFVILSLWLLWTAKRALLSILNFPTFVTISDKNYRHSLYFYKKVLKDLLKDTRSSPPLGSMLYHVKSYARQ